MATPIDDNSGVFVETVPLLRAIQNTLAAAEKLIEAGDSEKGQRLHDAAHTVFSALVTKDMTRKYVVLPEEVRPFFELLPRN